MKRDTETTFDTIENVYTDPGKERAYALSLDYPVVKFDGSPGRTTGTVHNPLSESYLKIVEHFMKKGMSITVESHSYRISKGTDQYQCYVHTDPSDYQIVISLTPGHAETGDLDEYFVHDATGIKGVEYLKKEYDMLYSNSVKTASDDAYNADMSDFSSMRSIGSEPLGYNKAVIINCQQFHAPSKGFFGKTDQEARIIELYTIKVKSRFVSKAFPYIWYYENTLESNYCDIICDIVRNSANKDAVSSLDTFYFPMLEKMVRTYFYHIRTVTPEMNDFLRLFDRSPLHIDLSIEHLPQFCSKRWTFEPSNFPATFTFLVQLNDNDTGMQIYNHFTQTPELIPSKKGSLLIFPKSWMYPVNQDRIMIGDKIFVNATLSIYSNKPDPPPDIHNSKNKDPTKTVISYSNRGFSTLRQNVSD